MIELLENFYKDGAKSTKKVTPIISKEMVENDATAKSLVDEFSSSQIEKPSPASEEFTNNALSRSVDESQAGLFDIMLNNSKVQGSPVAMKKLSPIHNANLFKEFGLLHDSGKRRYYTTWKKDAEGVLLMEKAAKSRNEKYTNYYFVANEGYIDVYEKTKTYT